MCNASTIFVAMLAMFCAARLGTANENCIKNSDFEESKRGAPADWIIDAQKMAAKGLIEVQNKISRSGKALQLTPSEKNIDPKEYLAVAQLLDTTSLRGRSVFVSAWMGATSKASAVIVAIVVDDKFALQAQVALTCGENGGVLEFKQAELKIPNTPKAQKVLLVCSAEGTSGSVFYDDVALMLRKLPEPALLPPSTAPLKAEVRIDAAEKLRTIPRSLYGTNVEWIWDGNGIFRSATNDFDPEIEKLTRELKPSLLRWPGGTFSDFYHWRDGIGLQSKRKETQHMPGSSVTRHSFGSDEMYRFSQRVGGSMLITVNAGSGTAKEAAEWVAYMNKGADKTRRVEYWEIGNELYIDDGAPATAGVALTPEKYAARFLEFSREMKAIDPTIKVGAIACENYGRYELTKFKTWNETVLKKAGDAIDFLAVHNAYAPVVPDDNGLKVRTIYAAMLAAPKNIAANLDKIGKQIEQFAPQRAKDIRIAVTEWGALFQIDPKGRLIQHPKSLASALYAASVLKTFIESPQVDIANHFMLVDQLFMGAIGWRKDSFVPKATWFALKMFSNHFGTTLIRSTVAAPTFDSTALGWADRATSVPYLDVVSSLSTDRHTLYVICINKHFDASIQTQFSLAGAVPGGTAIVRSLTGKSIDANTGTHQLLIPELKWAEQADAEFNGRFNKGAPDEISFATTSLKVGITFDYCLPPHSITCLEIPVDNP
jgi:alpha-L-arabinofuranosidase